MLARNYAIVTRVDAALILLMWHTQLGIVLAWTFSLGKNAEFLLRIDRSNDDAVGTCDRLL